MDAILTLPPDLPPHDLAPLDAVAARTIAEWPTGTFLENLSPLDDGSFAVSVLSEARIDQVWPDGRCEVLAQFEKPVTGTACVDRTLFAGVGVPEQAGWAIWSIDLQTRRARHRFDVPDAVFLNGVTPLASTVLLAAESIHGRILRLDLALGTTSVWTEDERLKPSRQAAFLPGANGLKIFGGHAYVSSNGQALFCRIPINEDGTAGTLEVIAERLRADDLAFDIHGNAYLTTHIAHGLDRLTRTGERITLAGPDQGLAGSTACAFGVTAEDREALYVTTTGGIIGPVDGVVQPARLVRLEVGVPGAPIVQRDPA